MSDLSPSAPGLSADVPARRGRARSSAVRYVNKAAADDAPLLMKANRTPFGEETGDVPLPPSLTELNLPSSVRSGTEESASGQEVIAPLTTAPAGGLLDKPTEHGVDGVVLGIQGWRKTMEDAHALHIRGKVSRPLDSMSVMIGARRVLDSPGTSPTISPKNSNATTPAQSPSLSPGLRHLPVEVNLPPQVQAIIAVYDGHQNANTATYLRTALANRIALNLGEQLPAAEENNTNAAGSSRSLDTVKPIVTKAVSDAFAFCDKEHRETEGVVHGGSTAFVGIVLEHFIVMASLGDCQGAVVRKDGTHVQGSLEHNLAVNESEKERLRSLGTNIDNNRVGGVLSVSRAFGDYSFKPVDADPSKWPVSNVPDFVFVERTAEDQFVVVGCDGVWELQTVESIAKMVRENCASELSAEAVYAITTTCCATAVLHQEGSGVQKGCDNISFGVLRLCQS